MCIRDRFLIESILISVTGGLIGVVLGVGAALVVNAVAHFPIYIQPWSVVLSFAVCTVTLSLIHIYIEWCVPENITGTSQGRGNSGIFMQGMYEVQVLDCYNNETYVNGQTGSIYKQTPPLANAMRKPGEWNVYDIIYTAPIFKEDGTYRVPPSIDVYKRQLSSCS